MYQALKKVLFISLLIVAYSCKNKQEKNIDDKLIIEYNFDKFIKFKNHDYIYKTNENGGFFTTSYDYGITYDPKGGNDFGNLVTYLIPKDFLFFKNNLDFKEFNDTYHHNWEKIINKMSVKEIKEYFDIYVFFIDKKYLIPTPNADSPNKEKDKHDIDLYQYKDNKWLKLDTYSGLKEENSNQYEWKDNYIQKVCKKKQEQFFNSISKLKIDDFWYRSYYKLFDYLEYNCDYEIIIDKNECSLIDRSLNDILVPYQSKDTLFLFHKKSLGMGAYNGEVNLPDIVITKVDNLYYIQKQSFLKNREYIKEKVYDYGYLEDK